MSDLWVQVREIQTEAEPTAPVGGELWGQHPRLYLVPEGAELGTTVAELRTRLTTDFAEAPSGSIPYNTQSFQQCLDWLHGAYDSSDTANYLIYDLTAVPPVYPRCTLLPSITPTPSGDRISRVCHVAGWYAFCALVDPALTTSPGWTWPQTQAWYLDKATTWLNVILLWLSRSTTEGDDQYLHSDNYCSVGQMAATIYDWLAAIRPHEESVTRTYIECAVRHYMLGIFTSRSGSITATSYPYPLGAVSPQWASTANWRPSMMACALYGDTMPSGTFTATSDSNDPRTGVPYTATQTYAEWVEELMEGDFGVRTRAIEYIQDAYAYYMPSGSFAAPAYGHPYDAAYSGTVIDSGLFLITPFQRRFVTESAAPYLAHKMLYCTSSSPWVRSASSAIQVGFMKLAIGGHPNDGWTNRLHGFILREVGHWVADTDPTLAGVTRWVIEQAWPDQSPMTVAYWNVELDRAWLSNIIHHWQRVTAIAPSAANVELTGVASNGPVFFHNVGTGKTEALGESVTDDDATTVLLYAIELDPAGGLSHAYSMAGHLAIEKNGPLLIQGGLERDYSPVIVNLRSLKVNVVSVFQPGRTDYAGLYTGHQAYQRTETDIYTNYPSEPWRGMGHTAKAWLGSSVNRLNQADGVDVVQYTYTNCFPPTVVTSAKRDLVYVRTVGSVTGEYLVLFDDITAAGAYDQVWHVQSAFPWRKANGDPFDTAVVELAAVPGGSWPGGVWTQASGTVFLSNAAFTHPSVTYHGGLYLTAIAPTGVTYRLVGGDGAEGYDFGYSGWVDRYTAAARTGWPYMPDYIAQIAGRYRLDLVPASATATQRFCTVMQPVDTDVTLSPTTVTPMTLVGATGEGAWIQDAGQMQAVMRLATPDTSFSYVHDYGGPHRVTILGLTSGEYSVTNLGGQVDVAATTGGAVTVGADGILVTEVA